MAKNPTVSMFILNDYLNNQISVVDLSINALENFDPHIFFRVRSAQIKETLINSVDNMWAHASEQTKAKAAEIRSEVDNIAVAIRQTKALLDASHGFFSKLAYKWRLFRLRRTTFSLVDILTMHIAENGDKPEEKEELLIRLGQRIITADDLVYNFDTIIIKQMAPQRCISEIAHIPADVLPFLKEFCLSAKEKKYTFEQMCEAWSKMMEMKAHNVDCSKWEGMVPPEQALYLLFENLSYSEVKKHYLAFIGLTTNRQSD